MSTGSVIVLGLVAATIGVALWRQRRRDETSRIARLRAAARRQLAKERREQKRWDALREALDEDCYESDIDPQ